MEDRLDHLFQEWRRLGGAVLLARAETPLPERSAEEVLAETTGYCRDSSRLTWVALEWLIRHADRLDVQRLLQETREHGDLPVLGVLCDAARQRRPHPAFERIVRSCPPHDSLEIFFHRVARSPLASRQARENALPLFQRWNFLCDELHYL
jgi:hypothetical protein